MRFARQSRHEYEDTRRKRLAALRWQQRERESFPLLAAEIASKQPTVDAIMAQRIDRWSETQKADRSRKAAQWREGRRRLAQIEPAARAAVLAYWNEHKWLPGNPTYFLDMLHSIETGRLVWIEGSFRFVGRSMRPEEVMRIEPTSKPPMIPGLTKAKGPTL